MAVGVLNTQFGAVLTGMRTRGPDPSLFNGLMPVRFFGLCLFRLLLRIVVSVLASAFN
jgi:hypothetical protein